MTKRRATPGTGTVYKHSIGDLWVGQITIGGRRRRVYAPSKTEARAKLNELLGGGAATATRKRSGGMPLSKLLADWMKRDVAGRDLAPSTRTRHEWAVAHLDRELGHIDADALSVRDVEAALDRLSESGLSHASLIKVLQTLAQALTFGQRRDDVTRNVASLSKVPPTAKRPVKRRSLQPLEARELLAAVEGERNGVMFALGLRLGLRPGEFTGLYWDDLDLEAGIVNVTRGVRLTKGRAEVVDDLKTATAKRTLKLPTDLVVQLQRHRTDQIAERLAATSWIDERLVFATPTGNVLSPPNVRRHLDTIAAGITAARHEVDKKSDPFPAVRPNELRHSCASYLSDQGVSNEVIADVLGHTSTRMVDQTYRHRLRPVVDITATVDWGASDDVAGR